MVDSLTGGTHPVAGGQQHRILRESTANDPMDFDTCLWDEIQDMPGEIFDFEDDLLTSWENTGRGQRLSNMGADRATNMLTV